MAPTPQFSIAVRNEVCRRRWRRRDYGAPFVYAIFLRCRRHFSIAVQTPARVQGWSADEVTDDNDDDTTFCTRVHLVNLKTGKVLGGEED